MTPSNPNSKTNRLTGLRTSPQGVAPLHRRMRGASETTILLGLVAAGLLALPVALALQGPLPEAFEGAVEGPLGSHVDTRQNNVLPPALQSSLNIPSGGYPSPLFGAQAFTQKMLIFEEFGTQPLPAYDTPQSCSYPCPPDAQSCPDGAAIEDFLSDPMYPHCYAEANCEDANPLQAQIEQFLGRELHTPPCEGRPEGVDFSHQRWQEFGPQITFQTCLTGARTGLGMRDSL